MNVKSVLQQHLDAPGGRGDPPRAREAAALAAAYTYRVLNGQQVTPAV